jgi:hypothetical protein
MEKKITLEITLQEADLIVKGLAELPAKLSFNLIQKIGTEIQKSQKQNIEKKLK